MARHIKSSTNVGRYTNADIDELRRRNKGETEQLVKNAETVAERLKQTIDKISDDKLRDSALRK